MNPEKVLIVFFSRTGRTKILVREIANKLGCSIEEIKTPVRYSGYFGYLLALLQATFKILPVIVPLQKRITDYDLIILGGPVWGGTICSPVRAFIETYRNDFKNVAFISTQGGNIGQKHISEKMQIAVRRPPLATLNVSERDFRNGYYRNSISSFISKLSLRNPKISSRRIAQPTSTEATF